MHGEHVIKSWSTNQATIVLSSGEAEYYGMVKGSSQALGLKVIADDIGVSFAGPIQINTDASAEIGIGSRLGIGKMRHIEIRDLWLQKEVLGGKVVVSKVAGEGNPDDLMTKILGIDDIIKRLANMNIRWGTKCGGLQS